MEAKLKFTEAEWNEFGIKDLTTSDFIKVGVSYFQPTKDGTTPGLKWFSVGTHDPTEGKPLTNESLAAGLRKKTKFTEAEVKEFGISGLNTNDFIGT